MLLNSCCPPKSVGKGRPDQKSSGIESIPMASRFQEGSSPMSVMWGLDIPLSTIHKNHEFENLIEVRHPYCFTLPHAKFPQPDFDTSPLLFSDELLFGLGAEK